MVTKRHQRFPDRNLGKYFTKKICLIQTYNNRLFWTECPGQIPWVFKGQELHLEYFTGSSLNLYHHKFSLDLDNSATISHMRRSSISARSNFSLCAEAVIWVISSCHLWQQIYDAAMSLLRTDRRLPIHFKPIMEQSNGNDSLSFLKLVR